MWNLTRDMLDYLNSGLLEHHGDRFVAEGDDGRFRVGDRNTYGFGTIFINRRKYGRDIQHESSAFCFLDVIHCAWNRIRNIRKFSWIVPGNVDVLGAVL